MKYNASTLGRRAAAAAGVLTLAVLGMAPVVQAEEANYGNIKENAQGSLTIHKHLTGDGNPIGNIDGDPGQVGQNAGAAVKGVEFTAHALTDINLKEASGWETISALAKNGVPENACDNPVAPVLNGHTIGQGYRSSETTDQGLATITGMPVQAYLVCETKTPGDIIQKAKPFVVTIPTPNTATDQEGNWIYDVSVYPKNEKISAAKTIEDQKNNGYAVGSKVRFPVTSTLPTLDANSYFTYFQFKDTLDARLTDVTATDIKLDGTVMDPSDYVVAVDNQIVTVTFTKAGLGKLKAAPGKPVQAVFEGKVTRADDGAINNTAQLISDTTYTNEQPEPKTPPANPENPPTTNQVTTNWGDLTITKVDGRDTGASKAGLKGAEFQLFKAKDPYAATCDSTEIEGAPIKVNNQDTLVTDGDGNIKISGLFVSDSIDDASRDNKVNAAQRCYVLVETKAPTGYVLPADASRAITVQSGNVTTDNVTIENTKQSVPGLPLTGANGMLILTASGASLLMIAVGSVLVARYRERKRTEGLTA